VGIAYTPLAHWTPSAGQRSNAGNIYSGDYRSSASGARVNTKTGSAVAVGSVTRGNVYTGNEVTAGVGNGRTSNETGFANGAHPAAGFGGGRRR
jgi:hypothetical protein